MKICLNGVVRDMTAEEEAEYKAMLANEPEAPDDPNEIWKTDIEAALMELASMIGGDGT